MIGYLNKFYYKSTPKHFHDRDKHNVKMHDRIIIKVANNYGRPTVNNTTGLQIGPTNRTTNKNNNNNNNNRRRRTIIIIIIK